MCYKRALKALNLEPTGKIPLLSPIGDASFAEQITGVKRTEGDRFTRALYEALDVDMIYVLGHRKGYEEAKKVERTIYGGFEDLKAAFPLTDTFQIAYKGYKLARSTTATQLWVVERPFKTYGELIDYLQDYDPREDEQRSGKEIAEQYMESWRRRQEALEGVTLVAGQSYLTLFTFFIVRIGWGFLARLINQHPDLFKEVLSKYAEVSRKHVDAWSRTGIKAFVCHDDIATQLGPVASPIWFQECIFPHYRRIWRPIKEKGIKLGFISDGNYTPLMEGLAWAGAEGFKINGDARLSHSDFGELAEKYGGKKVLFVAPNWDVMREGSREEVVSEVRFLISLAKRYNGFFIHGICSGRHFDACYKIWAENRANT